MGVQGYIKLLSDRRVREQAIRPKTTLALFLIKELFKYLADGLRKLGEKHGEKVLATTKNQISLGESFLLLFSVLLFYFLAMSLSSIKAEALKVSSSSLERDPTEIGSMLFTRFVSGTRYVQRPVFLSKLVEGAVFLESLYQGNQIQLDFTHSKIGVLI